MERCLYCYKELADGERDFHKSCSKKIFGTPQVPLLPYTRANIAELAREVIRSQTTLTGVQAKLSLDIAKEGKGTPERFTIVGLWGRYILKPQTEHYPHLPELEDLTMHMAEAVRMQVVPHSLVRFADGELCYITRRIDRGPHGEKYPMEDLCQLSERQNTNTKVPTSRLPNQFCAILPPRNWMPSISGSKCCSLGSRAMPTCTSKIFRCIA